MKRKLAKPVRAWAHILRDNSIRILLLSMDRSVCSAWCGSNHRHARVLIT